MTRWAGAAMLLLMTGCKPAAEAPTAPPMPEPAAAGPAAATTAVSLDGEGLRFVDRASGRTSLLAFGAPRVGAEEALARVAGAAADRNSSSECGAGPMDFTRFDAMTLNFQDGRFVGWFLGDEPGAASYGTMTGIGIGTTRAKAAASVTISPIEGSTLGEEFTIGEGDTVISGIFSAPGGQGVVEVLFAGTNCLFR